MIELALNSVQKFYGALKVLDNISFEVQTGEKAGLIGGNGTGKTTILKIIAGIERQDGGMVSIRKSATLGYLDQIPDYPPGYSVMDVLNTAFMKQFDLRREMECIEHEMGSRKDAELEKALKKYGELQQLFEHSGGYEIDEKLSKVCTGLKIDEEFKLRAFSTLSGGEKTTVLLGKILLINPDILLLDEPSNHLDVEAMEWLEDYLVQYKGSALIVSHDRYFLDRVATKIVEIEDMESLTYTGNYSNYVKEKETRLMLQFEAYEDQQKKIKAMEKAIKDLRDWGLRADNNKFFRRAWSMQKRLDKMERIQKPILEKQAMRLDFNGCDRSGRDVVRVENLNKSFDGKTILKDAEFHIRYGEKAALIGINGSGKSTLVKILLKQNEADRGIAEIGEGVKTGYLPQNVMFENVDMTILECFRNDISITEGKAREYLAKFMFYGEDVFKKVGSLSGGERSRLKLCQLMFQDINFLILDEPTNHLDIESRESLEEALKQFEGTILFISHDRYFINSLCDYILELRDKKFVYYPGNYEYYKQKRAELKSINICTADGKKMQPAKAAKVNSSTCEDKGKDNYLRELEERIGIVEDSIKNIDIRMSECQSDYGKLGQLFKDKTDLQNELDILYKIWIDAN